MADLTFKGNLNLMGSLTLEGGKVLIDGKEALVEVTANDSPQSSSAPPVLIPPPAPAQPQPTVWIVNSFNKTVKAGSKNIVALGMAMQGQSGGPLWPGMVLPSSGNPTVKINGSPINVLNDMAIIFPSGGSASFNISGQ